ncbi:N-acetylglucosamine-6-phosphate deacetylase [Phenylobacterium sp.]|jgi:N-acetylglucosamine-6-phosphate deacetylase|uniref:N-acetylglucosamine-6-phosphate deacetylase n=1 Tax=Phenylobacterium sp. TaxID=1871053 RepID=UPI002E334F81|nr:N-acetylglucosamine-6-phosphate deacetylase [Phenylobacterium sp.]HEX3367919.1 N-acetylglucosamine-6-phosphate deacetylase [Phenylobacterium sp.]
MDVALINGLVMTDDGLKPGLAVRLSGDRIVAVGPAAEVAVNAQPRDLAGGLLLPGFIDIQVNGGGGALFNDAPTAQTIAAIGQAHRRFGTTGFLPTLISDELTAVEAAIAGTRAAIAGGVPGVLGVHIEGPFLNPKRKGIHELSKLRRIDEAAFELLTSLETGRTLVTLAPETTNPEMIGRLVAADVVVSAGHTNASYATVRAALDRGLSGFTHLFNAMAPLSSREPGVVGAALDDAASWCSIIVDGRHVDPVVLRIALRCKSHDRFILVTDAMPSVGSDSISFVLQGKTIAVRDGVCVDEHGTLAGSDLDMASAVRNAGALLGLSLAEASRMASRNPAEFLGLGDVMGRIAPGYRGDLVLLNQDLHVLDTWIGGVDAAMAGLGDGLPDRAAHG